MCKMCDAGFDDMTDIQQQQWLDQDDAHLRDIIKNNGWAIMDVEGGLLTPTMSYTVGLTEVARPELVVFGLDFHLAGHVLDELAKWALTGREYPPDSDVESLDWLCPGGVRLIRHPDPNPVLRVARRRYARGNWPRMRALQVVWRDESGNLPWERTYSERNWLQPLPEPYAA
jgi:hypothetical protein